MADFGTIQPITLTDDRKSELERIMSNAYEPLRLAALANYNVCNPSDVRRLRDEHLKHYGGEGDPLKVRPGSRGIIPARLAVSHLRRIEEEVLAGFIRTVHRLCLSFEISYKDLLREASIDDYYAEAAGAIWDAMYNYNGKQCFTTYIYQCVKNKLTNYVRYLTRHGKRTAVAGEDKFPVVQVEEKDYEELDLMREAVAQADLTPLERELIEAHLKGERGYRAKLAKERVNPTTGKLYTRQRLGQIFQDACLKCQALFEQRAA